MKLRPLLIGGMCVALLLIAFLAAEPLRNIFSKDNGNSRILMDDGAVHTLMAEEEAKTKLFYPNPFNDLRSTIKRTLRNHKGGLSFDDMEKLDFSKPGQQGYDDGAKFEVFNPEGPFKFPLTDGDIVSPDRIEEITTNKTEMLFVLYRRIKEDTGAIQDELWAIIPNIKDSICQKHNPRMIEGRLDFTPHSQGPVPLPKGFPRLMAFSDFSMCIWDSSKINYQFELIGSRQKAKNSDVWE